MRLRDFLQTLFQLLLVTQAPAFVFRERLLQRNNFFSPVSPANSGQQIAHNHIDNDSYNSLDDNGKNSGNSQGVNGLIMDLISLVIGIWIQRKKSYQANIHTTDQARD